ncbi:hypothetical protein [Pseudoalteromonas phage J2-1_QLiu-2017]|nr:hypothetical protein [Pseudoalteromonas phage J2-1_QLiu-2017]
MNKQVSSVESLVSFLKVTEEQQKAQPQKPRQASNIWLGKGGINNRFVKK